MKSLEILASQVCDRQSLASFIDSALSANVGAIVTLNIDGGNYQGTGQSLGTGSQNATVPG